jgi:hypothetical protein
MKSWNDLSDAAIEAMAQLGDCIPTAQPQDGLVKRYREGKCHFDAVDLRRIAAGCIEVADWLDERAGVKRIPSEAIEVADLYGGIR